MVAAMDSERILYTGFLNEVPIPLSLEACARIAAALDNDETLDAAGAGLKRPLLKLAKTLEYLELPICVVDGCTLATTTNQRCRPHYAKWYAAKQARATKPEPEPPPTPEPVLEPPAPDPYDDDFWDQVHAHSRYRIERDHL